MVLSRRNFLRTALVLPAGASLAHYEAVAASAQGEVKITAVKSIRLSHRKRGMSEGLIKIETDASLVGYGPCDGGPEARDAIAALEHDGGLGLVGKDPLAIRVHFHNMFYAHAQRERHVYTFSGIDMALWDLAGKILNKPVSRLLGGNFRSEIDTYSHLLPPGPNLTPEQAQQDYLSPEKWQERAQLLKGYKGGFQGVQNRYSPFDQRPQCAVHAEHHSRHRP